MHIETAKSPQNFLFTVSSDESVLLFTDYENNNGEEGSVSEAVWRNRYLMDYDPLNQLLVCMVWEHACQTAHAVIDNCYVAASI